MTPDPLIGILYLLASEAIDGRRALTPGLCIKEALVRVASDYGIDPRMLARAWGLGTGAYLRTVVVELGRRAQA